MSWITDKLLGIRRVISGVETMPERGTLEFAGDGVTVTDDTTNKRTVVTIEGAAAAGVVDPTPDTLALRGADGEVEAEWIQTTTWRTTSGGDAVFSEGSTTFARLRSTAAPAQFGDMRFDPATGQPYVYIDGPGVVPLLIERVRWPKAAADANAGDNLSIPIFAAPGYPWTITSVVFIGNNDVTADATDYAEMKVQIMDGVSLVGTAAITNSRPTGANATGPWFTDVPVSFALDSLLAFPIDATYGARLVISKFGAGRIVPAGLLTMTVVPWQGA